MSEIPDDIDYLYEATQHVQVDTHSRMEHLNKATAFALIDIAQSLRQIANPRPGPNDFNPEVIAEALQSIQRSQNEDLKHDYEPIDIAKHWHPTHITPPPETK